MNSEKENIQHTINATDGERQLSSVGNNFKEKTAKFVKLLWFRIKSFILWNNKNSFVSNNPQLTRLMEKIMTFKELELLKNEINKERVLLNAEIGAIKLRKIWDKNYGVNAIDYDRLNPLHDKLAINNDLSIGVTEKLRQIGFEYEVLFKNYLGEFVRTENVILEKDYNNTFTESDVVEILQYIEIVEGLGCDNIRQIPKK